jgi:hypothetical protein
MELISPLSVRMRGNWCFQIVGVLALGIMGCAPDTVTVKTHPTFVSVSIKTVAVVPFTAIKGSPGVYQSLGNLSPPDVGSSEIRPSFTGSASPVPHRSHSTQVSVPSAAAEKVTEMVYANLKLRPGLKTLSAYEVTQALKRTSLKHSKLLGPQLAQELGKTLSLDAIIIGQVRVYRERDGQKFAAIPAAVGFDVQLINAKNGIVIWRGDYFEEQKPLTEDLKGFIERGGKWVTAEELARSGAKRVMERLPLGKP